MPTRSLAKTRSRPHGEGVEKPWKQDGAPIRTPKLPLDPQEAAQAVALRYVSDESAGIQRKKAGTGFRYLNSAGKPLRDLETLARVKALAIPPAWTDVWICPDSNGHLQATGIDARGRKQYRYHPRFREAREQTKFNRMLEFARILPEIRLRVERDLKRPGLPPEKVLAAVVKLLESTLIRVGNEEYARENRSYGLTTLKDRHARVRGDKIHFEFKGKSGIEHEIDLADPRLAQIVKSCQELPGQELFQYVDDEGRVCDVSSTDVNDYIHAVTGQEFTAKDFRTWAGTVLAAMALAELQKFDSKAHAKKNVVRAVESVAGRLGNTIAVCRKCCIHPEIFNAYLDGALAGVLKASIDKDLAESLQQFNAAETKVLNLLRSRLGADANRR